MIRKTLIFERSISTAKKTLNYNIIILKDGDTIFKAISNEYACEYLVFVQWVEHFYYEKLKELYENYSHKKALVGLSLNKKGELSLDKDAYLYDLIMLLEKINVFCECHYSHGGMVKMSISEDD